MLNIELIYGGSNVVEYIGESPRLKINIRMVCQSDKEDYIYIPKMNFSVKLISTQTFSSGSYNEIGSIGNFTSSEPIFLKINPKNGILTSIFIPINTKRFEEMQKIRSQGRIVGFNIRATGLYSLYTENSNQYGPFQPLPSGSLQVMKTLPDSSMGQYIILSTEEYEELARDIKHFEIYKLEIPITKTKNPAQEHLIRALQLMENAKSDLIQNNYQSAAVNIRNVISNHLLERKTVEMQTKNVLKEDIKSYILARVPVNAKDVYKDILKNFETLLNSLLQNLHKFVHTDENKLISAPMPQDLETIFFITAHIIKYFSSYG